MGVMCRFYPLTGISYDISQQQIDNDLIIQFDIPDDEVPRPARNFLLEALFNSWATCYQTLRGRPFPIKSLSFDFYTKSPKAYYRDQFGIEVRLNTGRNQVVLDKNEFEQRNLTTNVSVHSRFVARREAAMQKYRGGVSCSQIVKRYLKSE